MNEENLNEESGEFGKSTSQSEPESRAALRRARDDLVNYAREQGINLTARRLTREQLHDRKLGRLQMAVANLERELEIKN